VIHILDVPEPPTPTPTATIVPPTETSTPEPPTSTPTPTDVPPTETSTPEPPTSTPTPTEVPPTATSTPEPPTITPTPTDVPPTATSTPPGNVVLFFDDFETDQGWVFNPEGTDTAGAGVWERGNPEETNYNGLKQLGNTVSGSNGLVTGLLAGSNPRSYDLDGGVTT